jgi:hypothetical protein
MTAEAPGRLAAYLAKDATECAEALDSIALLLRTCQLVAERKLAGADPALVHALAERLRLTRRAVADLQNSGRDGKAAAAVSRPVEPPAATQGSAGERLAPGSGAAFSGAVTESDGAVVAPIAGALLPAGRPPLPGGDFLLPRDVRCR